MGRDLVPTMMPAGRRGGSSTLTLAGDASDDAPRGNSRQVKYSREQRAPVGARSLNTEVDSSVVYGRRNEYHCSTAACLHDSASSGVAAVARDVAERTYASKKREPLGQSGAVNAGLPSHIDRVATTFGKVLPPSESAHRVMYAAGTVASVSVRDDVGTAKTRNYNWAAVNIDPTVFRFGAAQQRRRGDDENATQTTKALMSADVGSCRLVPLQVADAARLSGAEVGKCRNYGFSEYRGSAKTPTIESVKSLLCQPIQGEDDVGRPTCKSATLRRLKQAVDDSRAFGCPSIRTDLPKPSERKVTNNNNYGDDASASSLLRPDPFLSNGITGEATVTADKAKELALRCGIEPRRAEAIPRELGEKITVSALREWMVSE